MLIPAEAKARGKAIWFDEFADTIVFSCFGKMFRNRIVQPRFLGMACDETEVAAALQDVPPILDYLEGVMPPAGGFLVGDTLTLADIAVASPFVNYAHLEMAIDAARHPRLAAYLAAMHARPSFARLVKREQRFLAA